jgi:hypothetical protein
MDLLALPSFVESREHMTSEVTIYLADASYVKPNYASFCKIHKISVGNQYQATGNTSQR